MFIAGMMMISSCGKKAHKKIALKTLADSASYVLGVRTGQDFIDIKKQLPGFNYDVFVEAILQTMDSVKPMIDMNAAQAIFMQYALQEKQKVMEKNVTEEKDFLEKNKTKEGIKSMESGLQYEILTEGTGNAPATLDDTVVVHYKGTFVDGTVFDNSYERGMPWNAPLSQAIQAWQEMMPMMKAGSKIKLYAPAALAYGESGANKMMIFEMEVLDVKPAKNKKK